MNSKNNMSLNVQMNSQKIIKVRRGKKENVKEKNDKLYIIYIN